MKLEIEHLAPYLPYRLKTVDDFKKERVIDWECQSYTNSIVGLNHVIHSQSVQVSFFKPILRPLSYLTKEIEVNGEKLVPIEWIRININEKFSYSDNRFMDYDDGKSKKVLHFYLSDIHLDSIEFYDVLKINEKLLEWHFDIYGLIENDLAIDINTL